MNSRELIRQSKLHARTLAVLNYCAGTARRDAAAARLFQILTRPAEQWPQQWQSRGRLYARCMRLLRELDQATRRSSPLLYNSRLALGDRPVLHFLNLLQQMLMSLNSLGQHVANVQKETELLSEMLGDDAWQGLLTTCDSFAQHETQALSALLRIAPIGQLLLEENSKKRRAAFSPEEERRYAKAYGEYQEHYAQVCPDGEE